MNVYLGANKIDPQTLGSLDLEGIYRGGDEVWTNGDKYELITSNGNYGTIWHNLTEGTFVISRHPASHGNPNTWATAQYGDYPMVIIADHDIGIDPADDLELGTYTDGDGNTVKQILAGQRFVINPSQFEPGVGPSMPGYHVPTVEEYRELMRLVAPILASGDSADPDKMYLYKVLRFSLTSSNRSDVLQYYQIYSRWGKYYDWNFRTDSYAGVDSNSVYITSIEDGNTTLSSYEDENFVDFYATASPSFSPYEIGLRMFRNIEDTKLAGNISNGYCSHTVFKSGDIIYSSMSDVGITNAASGTNNYYLPNRISGFNGKINICGIANGCTNFTWGWDVGGIADASRIHSNAYRSNPLNYTTNMSTKCDLSFGLYYPTTLYLYIGGESINLSFTNTRPSDAQTAFISPFMYLGLTQNNIYLLVTNGVPTAADTRIAINETIDVSNNSTYQSIFTKFLSKKFVQIKAITGTDGWGGCGRYTAVNFGMDFNSFKDEVEYPIPSGSPRTWNDAHQLLADIL